MSEGFVQVKPPPMEGVLVLGVTGGITINLILIGDHVISTAAEPQDHMTVCMKNECTHRGVGIHEQ